MRVVDRNVGSFPLYEGGFKSLEGGGGGREDISSTCVFRWQDSLKPFLGTANAGEGINMKPSGPQMARYIASSVHQNMAFKPRCTYLFSPAHRSQDLLV